MRNTENNEDEKFHSRLESDVFEIIKKQLENTALTIASNKTFKTYQSSIECDLIIYKGGAVYVVIEVTYYTKQEHLYSVKFPKLQRKVESLNARYGVITDGDSSYLFDRHKVGNDVPLRKMSLPEIVNKISKQIKALSINAYANEIKSIFYKNTKLHLPHNSKLQTLISSKEFEDSLEFDNKDSIRFKTNQNCVSYEQGIMYALVGSEKIKKVCRYTSLSTIFEMINNSSIRLSGLASMNDPTEMFYAESVIDGKEGLISILDTNTVKDLNKRFILSLTDISRIDDLTMWRLYGDDAKGVCLVFEMAKSYEENIFAINSVSYGKEKSHPELNFLKSVKDEIFEKYGLRFDFKSMSIWKHYFKPYEYKIENEVRMLMHDENMECIANRGWMLSKPYNIVSPWIEIELNGINNPLILKEIILGPKCPEIDTNKVQIEEMIRESEKLNGQSIKVELSKIENYR